MGNQILVLLHTMVSGTIEFQIIGEKLPGIKFSKSVGALVDREPVYLGIQKKDEVIDLVPGNARQAKFKFPITIQIDTDGNLDFRGPFVHGMKGYRFLYLSWGKIGADGNFEMFRRAKLPLTAIDTAQLKSAISSTTETVVEGRLELTDDKGGPICARVADNKIRWQVRRSSI